MLAQLVLAQLTLGLTVVFVIISRLTRWRPLWLAWAAAAGAGWLVTVGSARSVAGYAAAGAHLIGAMTGPEPVPARLAHLAAVLRRWRQWLPAQLPVALIVAAAEASVVGRLGRPPGRAVRPYRPGALVAARRAYVTASLRRGEVATADGGCVGIVTRTGRRASISWAHAQAGVLLTGQDAAAVTSTGLDLATAAIQHRKTVIIVDLACGAGYDAAGLVGGWHDAIGSGLRASIEAACADARAPLLCSADLGTRYEPLADLGPDRAAGLVLAMIDWTGFAPAAQSFCADYLRIALAASAAGPAAGPHQPVLDDLAGLLRPGALQRRLSQGPAAAAEHEALGRRAAELATRHEADPAAAAAVRAVAAQLAGLRSAAAGTRLGQPGLPAAQIRLDRALAAREVVLFGADPRMPGRPATMLARLAVADLTGILSERAGLGAPADCLIWISGCEEIEAAQLAAVLALGPGTGTAVLLSTTAGTAAARLAAQVNVVAVRGRAPDGLAVRSGSPGDGLASAAVQAAGPASPTGSPAALSFSQEDSPWRPADPLAEQPPDALSLRISGPTPRLITGCRAVR